MIQSDDIEERINRIKYNLYKEEENYRKFRRKQRAKNQKEREIRKFYQQTIDGLKNTVSHSRKGKPHRQPWGMHIES